MSGKEGRRKKGVDWPLPWGGGGFSLNMKLSGEYRDVKCQ